MTSDTRPVQALGLRLRARLRADWSRVLGATVIGLALFLAVTLAGNASGYSSRGWSLLSLDLVLGALAIGAMTFRHRWPLGIGIAIALASGFSLMAAGAALIVFISLCARQRWPGPVAVGTIQVAASFWWETSNATGYDPNIPWFTVVIANLCTVVGAAIIGIAIRSWRRDGRPSIPGEIARVVGSLIGGLAFLLAAVPQETLERGSFATPTVLPEWWWVVDLSLMSVSACLILLRRARPLTVVLLVATLAALSISSTAALMLVFVSLCTRRRWREIVLGSTVLLVSFTAGEELNGRGSDEMESLVARFVFYTLVLATSIAIGLAIGSRRDTVTALRERAETAEREQASRVAEARATERARIAREMHDVLAHRISMIAMHSGALAYRTDLPPDQTREIAGLLRDNADHAVQELRTVLGVLRGLDSATAQDEPLRPQPTLEQLDQLIEEATSGGAQIHVDRARLAHAPMAETTARTGYRIVQESLTNARKHAPGERVTVVLAGDPDGGLSIEVRTPEASRATTHPNRTGSGMGLVGLTERAVLAGGRFSYGVDRADRFVVRAWLPWSS